MSDIFNDNKWDALILRSVVRAPIQPKGKKTSSPMPLPTYQLALKTGGRSHINYQGKELDFTGGSVLYLPMAKDRQHVVYEKEILEEGSSIVIFFHSPEALPDEAHVYNVDTAGITAGLFRQLYNTWIRKQPTYSCDCMALFYRIIASLQRLCASDGSSEYYLKRLNKSVSYIQDHFCDTRMDQRMLAELSEMNYDYFRHIFKKIYHMSPVQYINQLKIRYSEELLFNKLYSVQEISVITGFTSQYYFTRCFKNHTGLTPSQYRKTGSVLRE